MLARGLSVRDIEDAFKDENGRLLLSRTAVSQLGERLWEDYQTFAQRDLSEYEITYLFVDGIAERLRPGAKREPVLAAWGFTIEGRRVLLHMMAGSKEDAAIPEVNVLIAPSSKISAAICWERPKVIKLQGFVAAMMKRRAALGSGLAAQSSPGSNRAPEGRRSTPRR